MRTVGNFNDVYQQTKLYNQDADELKHRPINPVVRKQSDRWIIESGLESNQDADFECSLEEFENWFYESFKDDSYIPTIQDEKEFYEQFKIND